MAKQEEPRASLAERRRPGPASGRRPLAVLASFGVLLVVSWPVAAIAKKDHGGGQDRGGGSAGERHSGQGHAGGKGSRRGGGHGSGAAVGRRRRKHWAPDQAAGPARRRSGSRQEPRGRREQGARQARQAPRRPARRTTSPAGPVPRARPHPSPYRRSRWWHPPLLSALRPRRHPLRRPPRQHCQRPRRALCPSLRRTSCPGLRPTPRPSTDPPPKPLRSLSNRSTRARECISEPRA